MVWDFSNSIGVVLVIIIIMLGYFICVIWFEVGIILYDGVLMVVFCVGKEIKL